MGWGLHSPPVIIRPEREIKRVKKGRQELNQGQKTCLVDRLLEFMIIKSFLNQAHERMGFDMRCERKTLGIFIPRALQHHCRIPETCGQLDHVISTIAAGVLILLSCMEDREPT